MRKFHVGMLQAWIDVAKYYYATVAQTVVLTGVLKFNQLTWSEIGLIFGGILIMVCVVGVLHMKFIYPKHSSYLFNKNPVIQEFRKEFADLRKSINGAGWDLPDLTDKLKEEDGWVHIGTK